jgi:hypothetical protein
MFVYDENECLNQVSLNMNVSLSKMLWESERQRSIDHVINVVIGWTVTLPTLLFYLSGGLQPIRNKFIVLMHSASPQVAGSTLFEFDMVLTL